MKLHLVILVYILILGFFLRFWQLDQVPLGIHRDEESHGYNAYSLRLTGKDRYGQPFPILFRSFGSYQPPLYTYLAILPVWIFGREIWSIRLLSVISGMVLILITYLISLEVIKSNSRHKVGLIAALLIAISPWAIFYNRLVAEGSLGVTVFITSIYLFVLSLRRIIFFPIACTVLALSTHAYYSERIISILFLPAFIFLFKDYFLKKYVKWIILGCALFSFLMIPHLLIASTGALTRRFAEVGYINSDSPILGFIRKYLVYFSPRNLFFDTGEELGRMPPGLGVFYTIFIIPFFLGIAHIKKVLNPQFLKILIALIIIAPIPAALTGDNFYPLRVLDLIWVFSFIMAVGIYSILSLYLPKKIGWLIFSLTITICLGSFLISYFIYFKYERAKDYGYAYISLLEYLDKYKQYKVIVDSARDPGAGLRTAYLTGFDPTNLQSQLLSQLKSPYYSGNIDLYENYKIDNIEYRQIDWKEIVCEDKVLIVGDRIAISEQQVKEHKLKYEFTVEDISGYGNSLFAYSTNPKEKCGLTR